MVEQDKTPTSWSWWKVRTRIELVDSIEDLERKLALAREALESIAMNDDGWGVGKEERASKRAKRVLVELKENNAE